MKVLVITKHEDAYNGGPPAAVIALNDRDPDELYCSWIRKSGINYKDDKRILDNAIDVWNVVEVSEVLTRREEDVAELRKEVGTMVLTSKDLKHGDDNPDDLNYPDVRDLNYDKAAAFRANKIVYVADDGRLRFLKNINSNNHNLGWQSI